MIFGGRGIGNAFKGVSYLNDLWTYNCDTNIWTWIGGDKNTYLNTVILPPSLGKVKLKLKKK